MKNREVMPGGYFGFFFLVIGYPFACLWWFLLSQTVCRLKGHAWGPFAGGWAGAVKECARCHREETRQQD